MKLKNSTVSQFVESIKTSRKKIIVFGAGVIAQTVLSDICEKNGLSMSLECIIDNDSNKWKRQVSIGEIKLVIYSAEKLLEYSRNDKFVILITGSHYYEIVCQLEAMNLGDVECYILPIMYTSHLNRRNKGVIKESSEIIIPKKIHYMWFGSKNLPENLMRCVNSWKKHCPDYEIIRWDENNYDISKHIYMKQAYEKKMWGFIPDYARLDILFEHGGIYMDTDVELIKGLDDMLYQSAFTSVEKWNVINIGGGTGAVANHKAIGKILKEREEVSFINKDGSINKMASGYYDTVPFLRSGYILDGENQSVDGMNIYGFDYFHPYDYMSGELEKSENTFSIHHFNGGWLSEEAKKERYKTQSRYKEILDKMIY